jgi:hypothetical protein
MLEIRSKTEVFQFVKVFDCRKQHLKYFLTPQPPAHPTSKIYQIFGISIKVFDLVSFYPKKFQNHNNHINHNQN